MMLVENHVDGPTDEIYADADQHLPEFRFGHTQPTRHPDKNEFATLTGTFYCKCMLQERKPNPTERPYDSAAS